MSAPLRKFIGMIILLLGLFFYIAVVVTIATTLLPAHWTFEIPFYIVAGVAWALPLRPFMAWMNQSDPEQ